MRSRSRKSSGVRSTRTETRARFPQRIFPPLNPLDRYHVHPVTRKNSGGPFPLLKRPPANRVGDPQRITADLPRRRSRAPMTIERTEKFRVSAPIARRSPFFLAYLLAYVGRFFLTALKNHRHARPPSRVPNFIVGFFIRANSPIGTGSCRLATFRAFFARRVLLFFLFILSILLPCRTRLSSSWLLSQRRYGPRLFGRRARVLQPRSETGSRNHGSRGFFKGTTRAALPDSSSRCSFRDSPTRGFKF